MDSTSNRRKAAVGKRYVPPELVEEIFLRLPCKSLHRFKSVNKLMASFLHDARFINEHRKRNMKPSHYLIWDTSDKTKLHIFSLSGDDGYRHVKSISTHKFRVALSSSYGLVCIVEYDSKSIALLNPMSGKLAALPDLPRPFAFETQNNPGAPIKTTWRTNYTGFGFDPKSHKYKIVQFTLRLYGLHVYDISRCYVLTVNNHDHPTASSWRKIDISYQPTVHFYFPWLPIYVDGVLYWEMPACRDGMPVDVFAFDLSTEKISVFETKSRFTKGKHLTVLEGKLCCIDVTRGDDMPYVIKIWKLSYGVRKNVSWILSYKLEYSKLLYPLYVDDYKRVVCESFGDLYRYDLRSKSVEIYPVKEKVEGVAYSPYTIFSTIHSETIVPTALPS